MVSTCKLRVRYKDTDCMKVVYYGNYLTYFEVGRVEYLRQHGLAMSDVRNQNRPVQKQGGDLGRRHPAVRIAAAFQLNCSV